MGITGWTLLAAAPFVGSFLGVLVRELPRATPALWRRSACPCCAARLGALDLVPLLSYAALRGRCRHCGAAIGAFHPAIELAGCGVALWAVLAAPADRLASDGLLGWTLLALAWIDAQTLLLPDALTLPLLAAGLAEAFALAPETLADRALGAAAGWGGLAALGWLWRRLRHRDALGEGDAKLLGAGGAWLGWAALPDTLALAALAGIVAALAQHGRAAAARPVAFGPWLALAIWVVRLHGDGWGGDGLGGDGAAAGLEQSSRF